MVKPVRRPCNNIVSVRVSDEQMSHLRNLGGQRKKTVSDLIREALATLEVFPGKALGEDGGLRE